MSNKNTHFVQKVVNELKSFFKFLRAAYSGAASGVATQAAKDEGRTLSIEMIKSAARSLNVVAGFIISIYFFLVFGASIAFNEGEENVYQHMSPAEAKLIQARVTQGLINPTSPVFCTQKAAGEDNKVEGKDVNKK